MCKHKKHMLVATVNSPEDKDAFTCDSCGLSYPPEEYQILLQNKNLAFFRLEDSSISTKEIDGVPSDNLCHECLYNVLSRAANGKEMKVKMIYFGKERYGVLDPNDESGFL